jgi:hypothetical protein
MDAIFIPDGSGTTRMSGYTTVSYSSDTNEETVVETTESNLTSIFETAKSNDETLEGIDGTIDDAISDPLSFLDYLVLVNGSIEFDPDYVRE